MSSASSAAAAQLSDGLDLDRRAARVSLDFPPVLTRALRTTTRTVSYSRQPGALAGALAGGHTFVVPAYKESPFLGACLASLKAQTLPSRILITTSTPCAYITRTASALDIPVVVNPERHSIGADWNFAIHHAPTRRLTLAHQDDMYAPQFLAESLDLLNRFPDVTLTFSNFRQITDNGAPTTSKISLVKDLLLAAFVGRRQTIQGLRGRLLLSFGNPLTCSSVTLDRDKLGAFRFSQSLASNLDWDAWLTLIERGDRFAFSPKRLVDRRYNDLTETSQALRDGRRRTEDAALFERLWPRPVSRLILRAYATGY